MSMPNHKAIARNKPLQAIYTPLSFRQYSVCVLFAYQQPAQRQHQCYQQRLPERQPNQVVEDVYPRVALCTRKTKPGQGKGLLTQERRRELLVIVMDMI